MRVGLIERMIYLAQLKERAKGTGPDARVARFIISQMDGGVVKPL